MDRRTLLGGTAVLAAGGLALTGPSDVAGLYVERLGERQIMVWTRRPGHLWIRYDLRHFTDADKRMDAWRIQGISAVRQAGPPPATGVVTLLTTAGAYPYAIKPEGAGDHFGGIHGDELLRSLLFLADGRAVTPAPGVTRAEEFELAQDTEVFDPAVKEPTPLGLVNVRHIFTADGLRIRWVLRWTAARTIIYAYGAMLPAIRDDAVTTWFRYLDQAGEQDISRPGHDAKPSDSFGVQMYNRKNGLAMSVEVEPGFFNGFSQSDRRGIWVYDGDKYNKVYPTRVSLPGREQVAPGDVWKLDAFYRFAYPEPLG
ncbi:hypothetical protein [Nonomuraea typhae]|uniref:hypothetical protein n=1 Tax=Nonomuraea typhae TaxID=2603600 RepID=UPI0012F8C141|nr:hypothetical protein [Nonomuraea typhae]